MRERHLACACALLLVLTACNKELDAERHAWSRLTDQIRACELSEADCRARSGQDGVAARRELAGKKCKPIRDSLQRLRAASSSENRRNAIMMAFAEDDIRREPACNEEDQLDYQWHALENDVTRACVEPARRERAIREAEYLAACARCKLKERCTENLSHNTKVTFRGLKADLLFGCER